MPTISVYIPDNIFDKVNEDSKKWDCGSSAAVRTIVESYYHAQEKSEVPDNP